MFCDFGSLHKKCDAVGRDGLIKVDEAEVDLESLSCLRKLCKKKEVLWTDQHEMQENVLYRK